MQCNVLLSTLHFLQSWRSEYSTMHIKQFNAVYWCRKVVVGIHEWDGGTSPQMCRQISDKTVRPMVVPPLSPPSRFPKVYLFCLVPNTIAIPTSDMLLRIL